MEVWQPTQGAQRMSINSQQPQFSPIDLIKSSWDPMIKNAGPIIGGSVIAAIISIAAGSIPFASLLVQGPLAYGLYVAALGATRGRTVEFTEVFSGFQRFVPAFLAGLLIGIFTLIGMVFCIIPGIIVSILYLPAYLYMIDEGLDFWPAMEKSRTVVWDNFGQWGLLMVAIIVMNIVGAIPCGLGLFITIPLTLMAITKAYEIQRGSAGPPPLNEAVGTAGLSL